MLSPCPPWARLLRAQIICSRETTHGARGTRGERLRCSSLGKTLLCTLAAAGEALPLHPPSNGPGFSTQGCPQRADPRGLNVLMPSGLTLTRSWGCWQQPAHSHRLWESLQPPDTDGPRQLRAEQRLFFPSLLFSQLILPLQPPPGKAAPSLPTSPSTDVLGTVGESGGTRRGTERRGAQPTPNLFDPSEQTQGWLPGPEPGSITGRLGQHPLLYPVLRSFCGSR